MQERILNVPYHSQVLEIPNTIDAVRGCGITCLKMVMDYYKVISPGLSELSEIGKRDGGYGPNGWIHDYFVNTLIEKGLSAERNEKMDVQNGLEKIVKSIQADNPVIVSVKRVFCEQEFYHMLVITGYKLGGDGSLVGLYYNEPFSTTIENGVNKFLKIESEKGDQFDFENYWRKMAIFVNK